MKDKSWWIDGLNVVGLCVKLLHILQFVSFACG